MTLPHLLRCRTPAKPLQGLKDVLEIEEKTDTAAHTRWLKQEDHQPEASLGYILWPALCHSETLPPKPNNTEQTTEGKRPAWKAH